MYMCQQGSSYKKPKIRKEKPFRLRAFETTVLSRKLFPFFIFPQPNYQVGVNGSNMEFSWILQ